MSQIMHRCAASLFLLIYLSSPIFFLLLIPLSNFNTLLFNLLLALCFIPQEHIWTLRCCDTWESIPREQKVNSSKPVPVFFDTLVLQLSSHRHIHSLRFILSGKHFSLWLPVININCSRGQQTHSAATTYWLGHFTALSWWQTLVSDVLFFGAPNFFHMTFKEHTEANSWW